MKRILVIPGDGIGPEITREAIKLLRAITKKFAIEFSLHEVDWGANKWLNEGVGLPLGALEKIPHEYDAILFGALGDPRIPDMAHGREILLGMRTGLDLYINFRPLKLLHPSLSILKDRDPSEIDMAIFRENTQDVYQGAGGCIDEGSVSEVARDESIHTYAGVERIIVAAFEYAKKHQRKKVTLVDKSNAIKFGGRLWQRTFAFVQKKYPGIDAAHLFVDVAAMQMVVEPASLDVVVTSNLFGDILSDIGAGIGGGLGVAASANINPNTIALFEPVHGSAPDIAGQGVANPLAMFMSVALMMRHLQFHEAACAVEGAVVHTIDQGCTTKDLGGTYTTTQVADFIINSPSLR